MNCHIADNKTITPPFAYGLSASVNGLEIITPEIFIPSLHRSAGRCLLATSVLTEFNFMTL